MKTIILRFRDLVTPRGRTIAEHREIIDRLKYTWWGWWRYPYEIPPRDHLQEIARQCPIKVYLLDTGVLTDSFQLYPATLEDIAMAPTDIEIPSPNVAATPKYYNTLRLSVWFRFSEIDQMPLSKVSSLRLLSLPTWPKTNDTKISSFVDKEIRSQEDFRGSNVTLWYVEIEV